MPGPELDIGLASDQPAPDERGWFSDPWQAGHWRWFDGVSWSNHVGRAGDSPPRLPAALSWPVAVSLVATTLAILGLVVVSPLATAAGLLLGMVPMALVLPVLAWLDRVEPEPLRSRVHALLWGAVVAGFGSGVVNTIVALLAGDVWAAIGSAPIVEEALKGLGLFWAIRRRELDSVMDGIVYAGWIAVGFAAAENVLYFSSAANAGFLLEIFVVRGLLTPFAHPLFTAWIGLALGLAVSKKQPLLINAAWGYGLAAASHAAWNSTLAYTQDSGSTTVLAVAMLAFVGLFVAAAVTVVSLRRRDETAFVGLVPVLAQRYGMTDQEVSSFATWARVLATRRNLSRQRRRHFDSIHAALAQLAESHRRPEAIDPILESVLRHRLDAARASLRTESTT